MAYLIYKTIKANLPKGRDAKPRVYGLKLTMTAGCRIRTSLFDESSVSASANRTFFDIFYKTIKANLPKDRDAKPRVYGLKKTMTAGYRKCKSKLPRQFCFHTRKVD